MKLEDLILNETIEEVVLNMCTMTLCNQATHTSRCLSSQNNQLNHILKLNYQFFQKEYTTEDVEGSLTVRTPWQSSQISASGQWEFSDIVRDKSILNTFQLTFEPHCNTIVIQLLCNRALAQQNENLFRSEGSGSGSLYDNSFFFNLTFFLYFWFY